MHSYTAVIYNVAPMRVSLAREGERKAAGGRRLWAGKKEDAARSDENRGKKGEGPLESFEQWRETNRYNYAI